MRAYCGVENVALTAAQRGALIDVLQRLAPDGANPCQRNHWRIRLDGEAAIFEADWQADDWTVASITARLGTVLGVDPASVTVTTQHTDYGPVLTFSRGGTARLRVVAFGGTDTTWPESHAAVLAYLAAERGEWESAT